MGCWKLGGVTCGVLVCLFGVLFLVVYVALRPRFGSIIEQSALITQCRANLEGDRAIQGALQRYRFREDEYPPDLLALHPTYVSRRTIFHCPADPSGPEQASYVYRRVPPDAPDTTPIVICDHHSGLRLQLPIRGMVRLINKETVSPAATER